MKSKLTAAMIAGLLAAATTQVGHAQTNRMHLGPHMGYNFDVEKLGIGAQFSAPIARHLEFYPSFDYYVNAGSLWALNADLKYRLGSEGWNWLYVGGGLNVAVASRRTNAGINLIAGAESLRGNVHPFGELRVTVGNASTAQLAIGLNFTLSQHR